MRCAPGARLDRHLVPHVISLLARDDMTDDVVRLLRDVADRATGQLVDAMLDPSLAPIIRRRLPQVLAGSGSRLAIIGLLDALNDSEFEVRFRAAGALVRSREAHPDRMVPQDVIFRTALAEIGRSRAFLEHRASDPGPTKALELVFRILSLALDPEPLNLAQRAFRSADPQLRGTALEYLETVLPADIVEALQAVDRHTLIADRTTANCQRAGVGAAGVKRRRFNRRRSFSARAGTPCRASRE
jgi:hypothetical protein